MLAALVAAPAMLPLPAAAAERPDRDQLAAALLGWMACEVEDCPPPRVRAILRRWRCAPADDGFTPPPRLLCHFSGHYRLTDGSRAAFPAECAYLWRTAARWTVLAAPDHEVCED